MLLRPPQKKVKSEEKEREIVITNRKDEDEYLGMLATINDLKQELEDYERLKEEDEDHRRKLNNLYKKGVIDEHGNPLPSPR